MAAYVATHDRSVLPKKYEDTQISVIKKSTHEDILVLGNDIYQQICDDHEKKQLSSLSEVEKQLTAKAAEEKTQALKEAKEVAEVELEKAMTAAKKAQEKAVKAESKRVEAFMKKLAAQQVQQEKEEGEDRLQEALIQARKEFDIEKAAAIEKARKEEQRAAAAEAKNVAATEEDKRKKIILVAEKEKQEALKSLKDRLKEEETIAVKEMKEKCEKDRDVQLKALQAKHEDHVKELEAKIEAEKQEQIVIQGQLENTKELKLTVEERIMTLALSFQAFIDTTKGFDEGQADFLIPGLLAEVLQGNQ